MAAYGSIIVVGQGAWRLKGKECVHLTIDGRDKQFGIFTL
jgi:hypothetical protein